MPKTNEGEPMEKNLYAYAAASLAALILSGCAASSTATDLAATSVSDGGVAAKTAAGSLTSSATARGFATAHTAALPGLLNPGTLLSSGAAALMSAHNARRNEAAAAKVAALTADGDRMERGMRNMIVVAYNREHGTRFRTYDEIMTHETVKDYNKRFKTACKNLDDCRRDFNRRAGTRYKNAAAFKKAIDSGEVGRIIKKL
jgi:hypothetical protein